jgi:hypothetical protein
MALAMETFVIVILFGSLTIFALPSLKETATALLAKTAVAKSPLENLGDLGAKIVKEPFIF